MSLIFGISQTRPAADSINIYWAHDDDNYFWYAEKIRKGIAAS